MIARRHLYVQSPHTDVESQEVCLESSTTLSLACESSQILRLDRRNVPLWTATLASLAIIVPVPCQWSLLSERILQPVKANLSLAGPGHVALISLRLTKEFGTRMCSRVQGIFTSDRDPESSTQGHWRMLRYYHDIWPLTLRITFCEPQSVRATTGACL